MRRLAGELRVGTMTLYGYFRGRDELLDALVAAAARQMSEAPPEGSWREQLRQLFVRLHHAHLEHPAIVELRLRRPLMRAGALALTERAMRVLLDAGFDERAAAHAYRSLYLYTFGFAAFAPASRADADRDATAAAFAALPPADYPALTAARDEATAAVGDEDVFEFGLDRLLDGLEALLASQPD